MPQHIFTGQGAPDSVTPNNAGDHYTDLGSMPPAQYFAVGDAGNWQWLRMPSLVFEAFADEPAAGGLWITPPEANQQRIGVSNGNGWKQLATIRVDGAAPPSPVGREPGLYLDNQSGALYVCDGLGSWFSIATTLVE